MGWSESRGAKNTKPLRDFLRGEKRSPYTLFTPYRTSKNRGHSSSVEYELPKLGRWVRFPLPAPYDSKRVIKEDDAFFDNFMAYILDDI